MKPRVLIVVVVLLVLPTALLTLVAGNTLRDRELFLDARIRASARNAVRAVVQGVSSQVESDLFDIKATVADALHRGGNEAELRQTVAPLVESHPLINAVYVFMNPWGFVYPPSADQTNDASIASELTESLRKAVATAALPQDMLSVSLNDRAWCFVRLEARRALYIGLEVSPEQVHQLLRDSLLAFSGGGITLCASGPGLDKPIACTGAQGTEGGGPPTTDYRLQATDRGAAGAGGDVVIRNSFAGKPAVVDRTTGAPLQVGTLARGGDILSEMRLMAPLDPILISAWATDPAALHRGQRRRLQLQAWGIGLLSLCIALGIALVLRLTSSEVKAARARSEFVIGVSHDLRTPLASMKMLSESLFEGRVSGKEKEKQFLGLMVRECERLNQLVERVLFFVRFGQNALAFRAAPTAADAVVATAVASFEARFKMSASGGGDGPATREHALAEVKTVGTIPPVCVDEGALVQVLLNLLDNAWKYSRVMTSAAGEEEKPVTVTLRTVRCRRHRFSAIRDWVTISVRDHGMGITPRVMKRIFSRFYRGPAAEDSNVSGVGLGLALCRHVVKAHGGWIVVASEPGQGSTFTVYLPVADREN